MFFSSNLTAEVVPYNKIIKVVIVNGIYLLFQIKFSHSSVVFNRNILLKQFKDPSLQLTLPITDYIFPVWSLSSPQSSNDDSATKKDSLGECVRLERERERN